MKRENEIHRTRDGRYTFEPRCHGCGKSSGEDYCTDAEVCGSSDGPGFSLCTRDACARQFEGRSPAERLAIYAAQCTENDAADREHRRARWIAKTKRGPAPL